MLSNSPTLEILARAVDVSALRQSVYAANIANASVQGYRRLEVSFNRELELAALQFTGTNGTGALQASSSGASAVVVTDSIVKLDEEMGLMAKNALRYQTLLGAIERTNGLMQMAIREGRG